MRGHDLVRVPFEQSLPRQFAASFGDFYTYCLETIDLNVVWFYQHPGERSSWVVLEPFPGEAHILLTREVSSHVLEIHVAEELWHVVQYCQGFCTVVPQPNHPEWESVAPHLSSLLLDPLPYGVISSFGLDLERFFSDVVGEKRSELEDVRLMMRDFADSPKPELRMYWGALLNLASSMMELPPPFLEEVGDV